MLLPRRSNTFRGESLRGWLRFIGVVTLVWFLARQGLFGVSREIVLMAGRNDLRDNKVGQLSLPKLEASGIARSSTPGLYWVHNDSGDEPRIFCVREDGTNVGSPSGCQIQGAEHKDWEDLRIAGGTMYIADTGNNLNLRRDQKVYVLPEPKPGSTSAPVEKVLPVAFPGREEAWYRWDLDCEACFPLAGKLWFLTKERYPFQLDAPRRSTRLFDLDLKSAAMKLVGANEDLNGWVTSADVSPAEDQLAVLCEKPVQSVWLFRVVDGVPDLQGPSRRFVCHGAGSAEGICFSDSSSLLILNEKGLIFKIQLDSSGFHDVSPFTANVPSPR